MAELWGVIFKHFGVTILSCMAAMILLKVVRQLIKSKKDNLDDIAGYAYIWAKVTKDRD